MPLRSNTAHQNQQSSYINQKTIQALQFGILSPEVIQATSVAEIRSTQIYDQVTFAPNFHAMNDPRMGVMDKDANCYTCKARMETCPGHFGHISLNTPVYHPGLLVYLQKILRCVCYNCSRVLFKGPVDKVNEQRQELLKIKSSKARFKALLKLVDGTNICESQKAGDPASDSQCGCGFKQPKIRKGSLKVEIEHRDENFDKTRDRKGLLWPEDALRVLERISDEDCKLLGLNPQFARPEWTIIQVLPVAPPPVRPSVAMGTGMRSEDDLTFGYQQVLKINILLHEQIQKGANQTVLDELKSSLQYYVATILDNKIAGQPIQKHKSGKPLKCLRSRLRGKEGRIRCNLMGKRCDFSARTVITPDPNLQLDQLGVPFSVAQRLTFPETVTSFNLYKLKQLVMRGPDQWPGAKYIIRHDGRQIDLSMVRCLSDQHLEPGYIVERHLDDGDLVLFNRQPSLHKMSMMGHRVKVLPYSTFRMNLSVTTPYNADFDGDEMNIHVPQSYENLSEIKELMAVPKQILAPQANKPCMGIVQDSLLGALLMTSRDSFIDLETAMQLIMWMPQSSTSGEVITLPQPAILKPKPLWTGKQIFSMVMPRVNLSRVKNNQFSCDKDLQVHIEKGELLCGALSKAIIGSTGQGLNHVICKDIGQQTCADFLAGSQKVINQWLIYHGFTVGVQDIIVADKSTSDSIRNILKDYKKQVYQVVDQSQMGQLKSLPGKTMLESFEVNVNKKLNDARDKSGNAALDGLSQHNRLRNMVIAGSKGSNINISQIMACVGQQNVEGGRIPFGFLHSRRTLPHFAKDDYGPESKGFVESSYLRGLAPEELYFHAMGGREGLIDTAVKTAETGYISRRLIKALEDIMVQYDGTVRTSRNEILQFLYGEDGMAGEFIEDLTIDVLKQSNKELQANYLFPTAGSSEKADQQLASALHPYELQNMTQEDQLDALAQEFKEIAADRQLLRTDTFKHTLDDQVHLPVNIARLISNAKAQFAIKPDQKTLLTPLEVTRKVKDLVNNLNILTPQQQKNSCLLQAANTNAKLLFTMHLRHKLCSKAAILQDRLTPQSLEWLCAEIKSKFEQSVVHPGEMVGSLAAQSLGEPATQMTLNTFHFAGISSKNVTLGVPRFKEIINVNKNIKTPGLKIYLEEAYRNLEKKVSKVAMAIEWTTLAHVVSSSAIYYDPNPERTIIPEDQLLVQLYNDVPQMEDEAAMSRVNPWLLRLCLDKEKLGHKALRMSQIDKKLSETFKNQISCMVSDDNSEKHVIRIRLNNVEDEENQTVANFVKNEFEPSLLHELALKGLPEITKVTFQKINEPIIDKQTGKISMSEDQWLIETDGSALAKVLAIPKIDATRTISNDNLEVLNVLGVEAARQSLINEMRFVFSNYGIYVNYRHISTLVDVMSFRGKLTSITRSGINRIDSGVLRKSTFEETVEILMEGAMFAERDPLLGISENVILGQLGNFGSGSFGLGLDTGIIEQHSKNQFGLAGQLDCLSVYEEGYDTPIVNPDDQQVNNAGGICNTPMIGLTPYYSHATPVHGMNNAGGATTPYHGGMTPGSGIHGGQFSPGFNDMAYGGVVSPGYQSPSPGYLGAPMHSPGIGQSPIYGAAQVTSGQYISPNYAGGMGMQSPQGVQSPNYMPYANHGLPVGGVQSPNYIATNGNRGAGVHQVATGVNPYSPAYNNASNVNNSHGNNSSNNHVNPNVQSPGYSQYPSVQSPLGMMQMPAAQSVSSPSYSPGHNPNQSGSAGNNNMITGAFTKFVDNQNQMAKPSFYSPSYSPASANNAQSLANASSGAPYLQNTSGQAYMPPKSASKFDYGPSHHQQDQYIPSGLIDNQSPLKKNGGDVQSFVKNEVGQDQLEQPFSAPYPMPHGSSSKLTNKSAGNDASGQAAYLPGLPIKQEKSLKEEEKSIYGSKMPHIKNEPKQ